MATTFGQGFEDWFLEEYGEVPEGTLLYDALSKGVDKGGSRFDLLNEVSHIPQISKNRDALDAFKGLLKKAIEACLDDDKEKLGETLKAFRMEYGKCLYLPSSGFDDFQYDGEKPDIAVQKTLRNVREVLRFMEGADMSVYGKKTQEPKPPKRKKAVAREVKKPVSVQKDSALELFGIIKKVPIPEGTSILGIVSLLKNKFNFPSHNHRLFLGSVIHSEGKISWETLLQKKMQFSHNNITKELLSDSWLPVMNGIWEDTFGFSLFEREEDGCVFNDAGILEYAKNNREGVIREADNVDPVEAVIKPSGPSVDDLKAEALDIMDKEVIPAQRKPVPRQKAKKPTILEMDDTKRPWTKKKNDRPEYKIPEEKGFVARSVEVPSISFPDQKPAKAKKEKKSSVEAEELGSVWEIQSPDLEGKLSKVDLGAHSDDKLQIIAYLDTYKGEVATFEDVVRDISFSMERRSFVIGTLIAWVTQINSSWQAAFGEDLVLVQGGKYMIGDDNELVAEKSEVDNHGEKVDLEKKYPRFLTKCKIKEGSDEYEFLQKIALGYKAGNTFVYSENEFKMISLCVAPINKAAKAFGLDLFIGRIAPQKKLYLSDPGRFGDPSQKEVFDEFVGYLTKDCTFEEEEKGRENDVIEKINSVKEKDPLSVLHKKVDGVFEEVVDGALDIAHFVLNNPGKYWSGGALAEHFKDTSPPVIANRLKSVLTAFRRKYGNEEFINHTAQKGFYVGEEPIVEKEEKQKGVLKGQMLLPQSEAVSKAIPLVEELLWNKTDEKIIRYFLLSPESFHKTGVLLGEFEMTQGGFSVAKKRINARLIEAGHDGGFIKSNRSRLGGHYVGKEPIIEKEDKVGKEKNNAPTLSKGCQSLFDFLKQAGDVTLDAALIQEMGVGLQSIALRRNHVNDFYGFEVIQRVRGKGYAFNQEWEKEKKLREKQEVLLLFKQDVESALREIGREHCASFFLATLVAGSKSLGVQVDFTGAPVMHNDLQLTPFYAFKDLFVEEEYDEIDQSIVEILNQVLRKRELPYQIEVSLQGRMKVEEVS